MLEVPGVKGVFHVVDFIAVERIASVDWQSILSKVREIFGNASSASHSLNEETENTAQPALDTFGEVQVQVQMFRGIPMQIKLLAGEQQVRVGLPERFAKAALQAQASSSNLVMERKWEERGVRYGEMSEIGKQVADELAAAYDQERLDTLVKQAFEVNENGKPPVKKSLSSEEIAAMFQEPDWETRYAALEQMNPTKADIKLLGRALEDPKTSIRRLAVVYLGMIEGKEVLPYLFKALRDKSAVVRRTAGDTLSDLGDTDAMGPMMEALRDKNKLVRWRAARFLYEVGDETAIPALRAAQDDPEFEVSLQIRLALERIEGGEEAAGTVWQQMTRSRTKEGDSEQ